MASCTLHGITVNNDFSENKKIWILNIVLFLLLYQFNNYKLLLNYVIHV